MKREFEDRWFDSWEQAEEKLPHENWEKEGKPHIWMKEDEITIQSPHSIYRLWADRGYGFLLLMCNSIEVDVDGSYWGTPTSNVVYHGPVVGICGGYFGLPEGRSRLYVREHE